MAKKQWLKQALTTVTVALAAIGLLSGCAAGSSGSDSTASGAAAQNSREYPEEHGLDQPEGIAQDGAEHDAKEPGSGSTTPHEPAMVVTTTAEVEVDSAEQATAELESLAHKYQGRIEYRHEQIERRYPSADLTVRIPADQHDTFISELKALGTTKHLTTEASDVSLQKVDLDAQIDSLKSSIESLRKMLSEATTIGDLLEIERELDSRQSELQSLEAQRTELSDRISMSKVDLRIVQTQADTTVDSDEAPPFLGGLGQGWNDLVAAIGGVANLFGYVLPGLVVCAVLFAVLWFGLLRPRYRKARASQQASAAAAAEATSDQLPPLPEITDEHPDASSNTEATEATETRS